MSSAENLCRRARSVLLAVALAAWAQSAQANADSLPAAGLWQIDMQVSMKLSDVVTDGPPMNFQWCTDGTRKAIVIGGTSALQTAPDKCTQQPVQREAGRSTHRAVCVLDQIQISIVANLSGDFATAFTIEQNTRSELLGTNRLEEIRFKSSGRRLAVCPPEMKPGDARMPDGTLVKDFQEAGKR
jgi:hypothetical protein